MDSVEALLLGYCDKLEMRVTDFGRGSYHLLTDNNLTLKKRIEALDMLIIRIREYIFLKLLSQAKRLLYLAKVLCDEIIVIHRY